jgi:hypothetical protein
MKNSADTESNNSDSSTLSDPPDVLFHIPECIHSILDGRRQFCFDDGQFCKQALTQVASHLKACHGQFLGLQGDGNPNLPILKNVLPNRYYELDLDHQYT